MSSQPDISSGELRQEESLDREDSPQPQNNPDLLPPPPPPAEEEREIETQQPEPTHFEQPAMASLKQLSPDVKQRNTASLRRRPRGPAPPPPPPGSKSMTLGRIRPGEQRDVTMKSRGFTVSATTERESIEITTKPRSVSDALPPPSEKVEIIAASSLTPVGTRHRPTRKAPSRPAPTTPPSREKVKINEGKTAESRPKSLTGSPRRPPPNVPTVAAQQQGGPPPSSDDDRDTDTVKTEDNDVNTSGEVEEESGNRLPHEAALGKEMEEEDRDEERLQRTAVNATSSKPPSTPPKPRGQQQQRWSPGQSPSGGRRKEAATVICKDTEDGGKELIVKPSPHSKRKFAGPLVFKMPPPPSAPPNKSKAKKPPPPISAKPGKKDGTRPSIAETPDIYAESADSSVSESISDTPGEIASSMKASSPPKSLSDTLVSNEFTNLDELLSDSQQDNIATTDFSIEENLEPIDEYNGLEWNESGLPDSDSIPYQDPDLEMAAAYNFNFNNNNNQDADGDDYNYGDFPPPPEIPPPLSTKSGEDSDEWERDSNRTGELNFDSDSSAAELSKHSIEDGIVVLEEDAGPGGVVLLNVKRTENDDIPVFPEELEQSAQTGKTDQTTSENAHLIPPPASIPRDPSIGAQLSELDDVVSSLAELAAEVPSVPPPPTPPPPPPSLFASSQPHPITSSTPTQQGGEEYRPSSPEPPPIPLTLPPSLSDNDEIDDDDFPLGPPPPLVTSEPPSLTPSPPDSPLTDLRTHETPSPSQRKRDDSGKDQQQQSEEDRDYELLNKLKQRQVKGSSSWRRRRGSRDQEAASVDDGESELLERLKQRQTLYRQKAKTRRDEPEIEPSSTTEHISGPHSIPPQPSGMGTGTGGDAVQLQLQFLQQQVLQQQMMQLQQQFQQLHSYALQQGVSMPTNMMQVPGVGGAMLNQQAAVMTTPVAPPTGVASQPQQQIMMQTSAGPVLVPAASMSQMMHGQGIMPNPQGMQQLPGQGFVPNMQVQQMVYGQGIAQPQTHAPLMSTSAATSQPVMYGRGVSQVPPLPQTQPPTSIASSQPMEYEQGVSQDPPPPPLPQTQPPVMSTSEATDKITYNPSEVLSSEQEITERAPLGSTTTGTGTKVTPARVSHKKRSEDVRALVLGPLEDQFDSLMDQVRDADPTAVLKKVRFRYLSSNNNIMYKTAAWWYV